MVELRQKIRRILDADRQAYETVGDSQRGAHRRRQRGVRHEGRLLDQALHSSQTLGEREKPAAFQDFSRGVDIAAQHGRDYTAVAAVHLLFSK